MAGDRRGAGDLDGVTDGNIQATWFVANDCVGATLQVTARGLTSGETAQTTFTDAASYTVINTSNSSAVIGSLPSVVDLADRDTSDTAITIDFDPVVFATPKTIALAGTLNLDNSTAGESIIINGPAAALTIAGGGRGTNFSVFTVAASTTATLENLIISDGYTGLGGGICNYGTVTVNKSTLSGNSAEFGGGICNYGTVTVNNSLFSGNSAGQGGGIRNNYGTVSVCNSTLSGNSAANEGGGIDNYGTVTANNSTLSGNFAGYEGGGIGNFNGTATVSNSTLSGNSAEYGGGILNNCTVTVSNSTLSGNSAAQGGGILNYGTVMLLSTIVAGNTVTGSFPGIDPDIYGSVTPSSAYNLIGDGTGLSGISNGGNHNQVGVTGSDPNPIDPLLGPLQNNSGPTDTLALLPGSPAIGAGEQDDITTDQRGYPRPASQPDIGAYQMPLINASKAVLPPVAEGAVSTSSVIVATFTHASNVELAGDFTATVDWGISGHHADTAMVTQLGGAGTAYTVSAMRPVFKEEGMYTVRVAVSEVNIATTVTDIQAVTDPAVIATGIAITDAVEGKAFTEAVATFIDPGGPEPVGDYSATIDWGDLSRPSVGTITLSGGLYTVKGSHTYAEESAANHPYEVIVTIRHETAPSVTVHSTAKVSDPAVRATGGFTVTAVEGKAFTDTVATFIDPGGPEAVRDYSATINWGDRSPPSVGTITRSGGLYTVKGKHTYAEETRRASTMLLSLPSSTKPHRQSRYTARPRYLIPRCGRRYLIPRCGRQAVSLSRRSRARPLPGPW